MFAISYLDLGYPTTTVVNPPPHTLSPTTYSKPHRHPHHHPHLDPDPVLSLSCLSFSGSQVGISSRASRKLNLLSSPFLQLHPCPALHFCVSFSRSLFILMSCLPVLFVSLVSSPNLSCLYYFVPPKGPDPCSSKIPEHQNQSQQTPYLSISVHHTFFFLVIQPHSSFIFTHQTKLKQQQEQHTSSSI